MSAPSRDDGLSPNLLGILERVSDPTRGLLDQACEVARRLAGLLDEIDMVTNADAEAGQEVYVGVQDADELVELLDELEKQLQSRGWSA